MPLITGRSIIPVPSAPSEQTVLIDAISPTVPIHGSGAGVVSFVGASNETPVVGSGPNGTSNLCLLFAITNVADNGSLGITSVVWDPVASAQNMTLVPGSTTPSMVLYYLMNPTLGAKNLVIHCTNLANDVSVVAASFVNVDQTGGVTSFPNVNAVTGGPTGTPTVSISTALATRKIIAGFASRQSTLTVPVNGIDLGQQSVNNLDSSGSYDTGAATSMAYAGTGSATWEAVAAAIKGV